MPHPVPQAEAKKLVTTFAWASFLHDIGSDMAFSIWPLFLTQTLKASMTTVGLVDGIGDAVVSISQAVSGYVSDRIRKRKPFVWIGYLFGGAAHLGYSLAPTWGWVIPFRILDRSGKMRGSPRDAMVSDVSTDKDRGTNFGILRMMDNAGAVVGIVIAMVLVGSFGVGYRSIFLISAVPSLFAMILVLARIRETGDSGRTIFRGIRFSDFSPNLRLYFALNAVFSLAAFSYSFLLLSAVKSGFQGGTVPALYLVFTLVAALSSLPAGRLADRIGRKPLLFFSLGCWALVTLLFVSGSGPVGAVLAFVFYGLHKGALDPVQKTLAAELASKEFVASTLGGFQMLVGLLSFPSSLIAGLLWDRYGMGAPFLLSFVLTLVAALLLCFVRENKRPG